METAKPRSRSRMHQIPTACARLANKRQTAGLQGRHRGLHRPSPFDDLEGTELAGRLGAAHGRGFFRDGGASARGSRDANGRAYPGPDREDLTEDILLQLWKAWPTFRAEASPRRFVYRVAHNVALDHLRSSSRSSSTIGPSWLRSRGEALGVAAPPRVPGRRRHLHPLPRTFPPLARRSPRFVAVACTAEARIVQGTACIGR